MSNNHEKEAGDSLHTLSRSVPYTRWDRYGLPRWPSAKEPACQSRRCRRHGFDPWVGKILWRRKWQPTLVFLPRKPHGGRSLAGYNPWGRKEADRTEHKTGTRLTPQNRDARDLHTGPGDPGTQSKAESLYWRRGQAPPTYQGLTMVPEGHKFLF